MVRWTAESSTSAYICSTAGRPLSHPHSNLRMVSVKGMSRHAKLIFRATSQMPPPKQTLYPTLNCAVAALARNMKTVTTLKTPSMLALDNMMTCSTSHWTTRLSQQATRRFYIRSAPRGTPSYKTNREACLRTTPRPKLSIENVECASSAVVSSPPIHLGLRVFACWREIKVTVETVSVAVNAALIGPNAVFEPGV